MSLSDRSRLPRVPPHRVSGCRLSFTTVAPYWTGVTGKSVWDPNSVPVTPSTYQVRSPTLESSPATVLRVPPLFSDLSHFEIPLFGYRNSLNRNPRNQVTYLSAVLSLCLFMSLHPHPTRSVPTTRLRPAPVTLHEHFFDPLPQTGGDSDLGVLLRRLCPNFSSGVSAVMFLDSGVSHFFTRLPPYCTLGVVSTPSLPSLCSPVGHSGPSPHTLGCTRCRVCVVQGKTFVSHSL